MKIGLVAGNGNITTRAAEIITNNGHDLIIVALSSEIKNNLSKYSNEISVISPLKVGGIIKYLKKLGAEGVIFIGKVDKTLIFKRPGFDMTSLKLYRKVKSKKDDTIMHAIGAEFEENGLKVLSQTEYLEPILAPLGVYSKRKPDDLVMGDVVFGFEMAKAIGALDIGQTVVVRDKAVMAVEAIEGTDAAIERGCTLAGKEAVIVKVYRSTQDDRFDIPTVGVDTLRKIVDNNGTALAVESGKTFIVDFEDCVEYADKNNLIFMSYKELL